MEEQGIISRASSPYCSPLTFALKGNGTIRVLLDAREISKYMIPETNKVRGKFNTIHLSRYYK